MFITSFRQLDVYQESYKLALQIHQITYTFPKSELFELGSQLRRAAFSIPANIAEGWGKRRFPKEMKHHLDVAIGSATEMEVHIDVAFDLSYLSKIDHTDLIQKYQYLQGKLVNLRNSWK